MNLKLKRHPAPICQKVCSPFIIVPSYVIQDVENSFIHFVYTIDYQLIVFTLLYITKGHQSHLGLRPR